MRIVSIINALLCLAVSVAAVQAQTSDVLFEAAKKCSVMPIDKERLLCFDQTFNSPAYIQARKKPPELLPALPVIPEYLAIAQMLEATRDAESEQTFAIQETIESQSENRIQKQVWLTSPLSDGLKKQGHFLMGCQHDITRVMLVLNKPVDPGFQVLKFLDMEGQEVISASWQSLNEGRYLDAGRGLVGIDFLHDLINQMPETIVIKSDWAYLDGARVDLSNLKKEIEPLRRACHW